jgi:protein-S-isoprenylcysteine O-methyltransferase Ste14
VLLLLRSVFFTILLPGAVAGYVPFRLILRGRDWPQTWGPGQFLALIPVTVGLSILFRCIWDFARTGRGTLAPVDPPTVLVIKGLYRYVRNPMYVGVLTLLVGEAALFQSLPVLEYAAFCWAAFHLFVILYEEPALQHRFGSSYDEYRQSVSRWLPKPPAESR